MDSSEHAVSNFKYSPATPYQAVDPAIRTSANDARPSNATGSTSTMQSLSGNFDQSTATRAGFPGPVKSVERPMPFAIPGKRVTQEDSTDVEDSGRKSLKNVTEGSVEAIVIAQDGAVQHKQNNASSAGNVFTSIFHGGTTPDLPVTHRVLEPTTCQNTIPSSLASGPPRTGLFASTSLARQQGNTSVEKQAQHAPGQLDEEFSQSLPLPDASFVEDSYQTQGHAEDSYQTQAHVKDSYQSQGHTDDSYQTQGYGNESYRTRGDGTSKEDNYAQADDTAESEGMLETAGKEIAIQSHDQAEDRFLERHESMSLSATGNANMVTEEDILARVNIEGVTGQLRLEAESHTANYHPTVEEPQLLPAHQPWKDISALADDSREGNPIGSQHKAGMPGRQHQEEHDSVSKRQTTADPRKKVGAAQSTGNDPSQLAAVDKKSSDVAPRIVTNAIQRSSSSHSRSVRVLPSKKQRVSLQSTSDVVNSNLVISNAIVPKPTSGKPHQDDVVSEMVVDHQAPFKILPQPTAQSTIMQVSRNSVAGRKVSASSGVKAVPESGVSKKKTHDSMKQQVVGGAKDQITGNTRYQKRINQSVGGLAMTAEELRAARDVAKPPPPQAVNVHLDGAVFQPIATPTKQQRVTALDAVFSRANISSPSSRASKVHPRAVQGQARQTRHDMVSAMRGTSRLNQSVGASHDGIIDEKAAINLMFKAREREAEITRLQNQVEALLDEATILEKEKIELVTKNEETLSKNEQALRKQKEAVARAMNIVNQSQEIRDTCQRDLAKIRESWTKSLQGLGMYKPELDEAKKALLSGVAAMHKDIGGLKLKLSISREKEERVIIDQLQSEIQHLGRTGVELSAQLEEEKSARSADHEALLRAMENVKAATEQCQGLREEFAAVQRASSDAHRTSLAALERERESLREGLESQIQSLTAENEALSDDNLTLQKALIKAETLAETLKDHLEDAKLNALQLEESHRAEDKAREIAYRSLEDEFEKLKQEFQKAKALVSSHETKMQELQAKIDTHAEDFNLQLQAHEMELSNEKHAAILKEKGLTADLSTLKAEYEATRNALTKSESDVQQKDGERQAIIEKYKQLKSRLKELQTGYEASVKDRESVAKNGSELAIELRQESQKSLDLERRLERLGKELADVAKEKGRLEADLTAAKNACESYLNCSKETEAKYTSLQDEVEELKKRAEDGQAAHSEDVTKERAKYDRIKASQESLKKRYQAGDLTQIEQDVLELHVAKIITEKDEELTTIKHKLTAAETEASRWRKTAGRASKEKSQQLGGPSLIGSDFEDQSSSPHEPLRSALSRTEHAPLINFGNAAEVSAQASSTPLTDIASSLKEQDVRTQTQTLTSFLSGAISTTKRVSFQELAGDASDEMDNDVPDTLGRIAGEEDEMEEDIEESESLMDTVNTFTARIASSIENFTQPANKHASVQSDKSIRSEISGAVAAPAKSTQNKTGNAALGMIRSTRSQTQATTYSGASRKRVASIVVGNDMESFTSTQEDAIYGKRGAIKKHRR